MSEHGLTADQIDTSTPHPARMYDYYLGGRDNYEVDRVAAQRIIKVMPSIIDGARKNRSFLRRAVRTVVGEYGIRQIIDIGTGIPTSPNTHEVAQELAPDTTVVYVDNDPIVGVHATARLTGVGHTAFLLGDVRQPASIIARAHAEGLIDFGRPVALQLVALMHFVGDADEPHRILAELRDALPSGSFLILSHATADGAPPQSVEPIEELLDVYRGTTASLHMRTRDQVLGFFDGFRLLDPGLVSVSQWRLDPGEEPTWTGLYGALGYKP
ncbi:MAG TPA: SAM-dependent methyltransferase [Actinocrinis sp.]|uniref:SAM-dependent methyltransferase n=1 Tax=Actinocrinis sp. TaxID=1920516 RepID=UPI002DDDA071|nr:SAM-dependent methyltransferase [Actinocrinis sp.]HEV2346852.1 SAM-dependent methyltransferase [Actinocrinis sp.]